MANLFINIPAPPGDGSGAATNVALMGFSKTISVAGLFVASVTIEISNEAIPTTWAPLATFNVPDGIVINAACRWMRATVVGYKSGAPVVNVGATDDGAMFASLPVPVGDGVGAAVDTSLLPLFKTVTVGGPFGGNVQLEVSTDGIGNWSQLGFGFGNPGQQSQVMAAQWMRVVRSGVPMIAPGLPIVDVGACSIGGGGGGGNTLVESNCFIWRPGSGLVGPVVFDDWTVLYAALQAARLASNGSGCYSIEFDDTGGGGMTIPVGAYNMELVTWSSVHGDASVFTIPMSILMGEGVIIDHLLDVRGALRLTRDNGGVSPCIVLRDETMTLSGGAGLTGGTSTVLVDVLSSFVASINIENNSFIGGGDERQAAVRCRAGGLLQIWLDGVAPFEQQNGNIQQFALDDDVGSGVISITAKDSDSLYYPTQIYLTNLPTLRQTCPMWSFDGDPNGRVSATLGFLLIDINVTGNRWRNTDGATTWVLDTSSGGSVDTFTFRPGSGLTGPSVFDDFNTLYAAFDAARTAAQLSGKFKIIFDDQDVGGPGSTVVIDSGPGNITYDFLYAELIGVHEDANTIIEWTDGGGESDSLSVVNALWWEGLTSSCTGQNFLMAAAADQTFTLTRTTWVGGDERMLFVGGVTTTIHLNDESQILRSGVFPAGFPIVQLNGATVNLHVNGANAQVNANAFVSGGAAALNAFINSSSARFDFDQADVGGVNGTMNTAAGYWTTGLPFTSDDPNGLLTATQGTLVMDERTGFTWRNTDGATAWARADVSLFALPEQWAVENVPAAAASTPMSCQVSTNFDDIAAMRAGSIVGLRTRLTEAVTAGAVQAEVTINGVSQPGTNVLMGIGSTGGTTPVAVGAVPYAAGDLIGVAFFSSVDFLPITTDLEAWIEVTEGL